MRGRKGGGRLIAGKKMQTEYRTRFLCSHTIQHICRSEKSFSHFIWHSITNIKKPFICCRVKVTSHGYLTTSLQATTFWEGPWKTGSMQPVLRKIGAWGLAQRDGRKNQGLCGSPSAAKGDSHAVGGHPTHWAVAYRQHPVPASLTYPHIQNPLQLWSLSLLIILVFSSKRSLQVVPGETDN